MTARSDELQIDAIARLQSALSLPTDGGVVPVAISQKKDDLDPRVSVGASLDSTTSNNRQEDVTATVRVIVDGTQSFVNANGTLELSRLQSDVVDELTTHTTEWYAAGLDSEEEIAWSDGVNRYLGVSQFSFERNNTTRSAYQS